MRSPLFLDTGAFIARIAEDDQFHSQAVTLWRTLEDDQRPLLSSEHILDESVTLIARRMGYKLAAEWAAIHLRSKLVTWLKSTEADLHDAIELMKKFADQKVSFTNCISFVFAKRERCKEVFTFDNHFERAGFRRFGS